MSVKYEKVEFEHAWQAAKAVCEGERIYVKSKIEHGKYINIDDDLEALRLYRHGFKFYREVKSNWWEKLDGTDENSVLVNINGCNYVHRAIDCTNEFVQVAEHDHYLYTSVTPVSSTQIEQWLKNAKEIEND